MYTQLHDTIVAISSPYGQSLRAIVRLSGSRAIEIFNSLQKTKVPQNQNMAIKNYTSFATEINLKNSSLKIPTQIFLMRAPHTYTKEDVVEIHTLGSPLISQYIIEELIEKGARLAEPGEFTMRAFLNGRIDLTEAEAVLDVIKSQSESELKSAIANLKGAFSKELQLIEDKLLNLCADVEANIDFIDQDIEIISLEDLKKCLQEIRYNLNSLLEASKKGKTIDGRFKILLFGPTNSGKSTLFNRLVPKGNVIVSPKEGTTRDIISGNFEIENLHLELLDSAGFMDFESLSESITKGINLKAMELTQSALDYANLILFVIDYTTTQDIVDPLLEKIKDKEFIIVVNKIDLCDSNLVKTPSKEFDERNRIYISALRGNGLDKLEKQIYNKLVYGKAPSDAKFTINIRQLESLKNTLTSLDEALSLITPKQGMELIAFNLKNALNFIGVVTGKITTEDILQRIFERFCIGK